MFHASCSALCLWEISALLTAMEHAHTRLILYNRRVNISPIRGFLSR